MCAHNLIDKSINLSKFFGGDSEDATPVPIPNTEVKIFSADGTAWATKWESRTPPKIYHKPGVIYGSGFFAFRRITNVRVTSWVPEGSLTIRYNDRRKIYPTDEVGGYAGKFKSPAKQELNR